MNPVLNNKLKVFKGPQKVQKVSYGMWKEKTTEEATFAAGCFWGVEDRFRNTKGVLDATVGYSGGHTKNPTYGDVCSGNTRHAESVHVIFDTSIVSFKELLDVFWNIHNPTTVNRQGGDIGEQYRSVIFYHSHTQKKIAENSKQKLSDSKKYKDPIVTEIIPVQEFYKAEEYHQRYVEKNGVGACNI